MEVRELLSEYEFPGDDIPVVIGSALRALEGDESEYGEPSVLRCWRRWMSTSQSQSET